MKSLRNTNFEIECSTGSIKIDEKPDSKCLNLDTNNEMIINCEQDYESAIKTVCMIQHFM